MFGYKGGRIKRIKIQNFMTYDDVEIFPKKGLNLVVGLNGSGKSSIMCAICLGLAGKPTFTGRATQLSDFIKHGCQEAEIEIELESGNRKSIVIRRKIKLGPCEWSIDNIPSSQSEVAAAVKKFNIDTSNLCQFLPQEKVAEFSRMNKIQRLENMLQAIGEPRLFKLFNDLKGLSKEITDKENILKTHQNKKLFAEEENERISDDVKKQEGRVRLKKDLDDMFKQKKILFYQEIFDEVQQLKDKEKKLGEELEALRGEEKIAMEKEDLISNVYQKFEKDYKSSCSTRKDLLNKITNKFNALANFNEQVENAKIDCQNKIAEKQKQMKRLHDINQQIEGLKCQIVKQREITENSKEQEMLNAQALSALQRDISELYEKMEEASAEKNQAEYSLRDTQRKLNELRDEQNKKMEILKKRDKWTYQAACWLRENKHRFKSNVYLPIMLEINVGSSQDSKYLENVIGFKDMIAFVCEDKEDCERLTDILKKQQNLPVNIVMAPETPMSSFVSPSLTPEHRQCGLECFVTNLFSAPEPIMRYLCSCYAVHRIPVARRAVPGNKIELILRSFQVFFSENTRVSGKQSRYGNKNLSVKKDFITAQNFLVNTNDELQREVEQRCYALQQDCKQKKERYEELKSILMEKEKIQEKLRQEKKSISDQKKKLEECEYRYIQKKRYQEQMSVAIDEEEEKEKIKRRVLSLNELRERAICDMNTELENFSQCERQIFQFIEGMREYSIQLKLTRAANEEIHDKVKYALVEFEKISKLYHEKKAFGRQLSAEIKTFGEEYLKYLQDPTPPQLSLTMEEVETKINHIQAQLNLNEDNEPLVAEYNKRKKEIEQLQLNLDKSNEELKQKRKEMNETKKEWLRPLQQHIANINRKFSYYFKELSCAGEICLDIPENAEDFRKYGLQINVKFHDEAERLEELSQNRHSGGECSVTAIVFILSLQELTEVPFRCIDEINQGMDSVNERKIYELIADSVADDRCSQYFLLTPKLLMDLEYPEDVAVHVIFNSPFLHTKLDVRKHLEIAQTA